MEIKSILLSQAIRFVETEQTPTRRSPVPLIRGLQDKYGFVQVPLTVADLDFKSGVSFLKGYYKGTVIEKFQIYENGFLCEAAQNNDIADEFLSEVVDWAMRELKLPLKENGVRAFVSQLEVISSIDLQGSFSQLATVGSLIAQAIRSYGESSDDFTVSGLKMHYDSIAFPVPRPPEFAFERRAAELFSSNLFFSSAPLRTDDHLKVLDAFEKVWA